MKALAALLLSLSLPGGHFITPPRSPVDHTLMQKARRGGRWYFAENGHAVYCYGPVRLVPQPQGGLQRIATFCQGDRPLVPLKD
jgi:hypothetical protein